MVHTLTSILACLAASILVCFLELEPVDANCNGCLNGGQLLLPNNIFGTCRCRCANGFKGPNCQFIRKRSGGDLDDFYRPENSHKDKHVSKKSRTEWEWELLRPSLYSVLMKYGRERGPESGERDA